MTVIEYLKVNMIELVSEKYWMQACEKVKQNRKKTDESS